MPGASFSINSSIIRSWTGFSNELIRHTAMDSTPISRSFLMTLRASSGSSGLKTVPSLRMRSSTSRRYLLGMSGSGNSAKMSYGAYRISRPISRMSRKPFVVIRPVRAPFLSMMEFMTSVVPWMISSNFPTKSGVAFSRARIPSSTASDGSRGVVRHLPVMISPVSSFSKTKSVNVPPISHPSR